MIAKSPILAAWCVFASLAIVLAAGASAQAQPRCVFLECGPSNTPNPAPAQAPKQGRAGPAITPRVQHARRPRRHGERCHSQTGFTYCASSVLAPQFGNTYGPENLVDENLRTAWVEGLKGQGEGEYVVVDLGGAHNVSAIQVMNGYHKNRRLFEANSRVKRALIRFSDGTERSVTLNDAPDVQTIEFGKIETKWVQFVIQSVYPGSKYADTAITELRVITGD
jgi:F5/8 type C domain